MAELLSLIIIIFIVMIIIHIVVKITSFLTKLVLWIILLLVGIFVVNYYLLPKLGKNPFLLKEQVVDKLKQDIKLQLKKTVVLPKFKVENMFKNIFTKNALVNDTTGFISK